jgi:hypothetical protein
MILLLVYPNISSLVLVSKLSFSLILTYRDDHLGERVRGFLNSNEE